jgi:hypothetical protein
MRAQRVAPRPVTFWVAEKENPAVGTPGQTLVVIGVYGFKYAAWLLLLMLESTERLLLFSSLFIFLFFYFLVLL